MLCIPLGCRLFFCGYRIPRPVLRVGRVEDGVDDGLCELCAPGRRRLDALDVVPRVGTVQNFKQRQGNNRNPVKAYPLRAVPIDLPDPALQDARRVIVAEQLQGRVGPRAAPIYIEIVDHAYDDDARLLLRDEIRRVRPHAIPEQVHEIPQARRKATQPRQAAGQPAQAAAAVRGSPAGRVDVRRARARAAVDRVAAEAPDAE